MDRGSRARGKEEYERDVSRRGPGEASRKLPPKAVGRRWRQVAVFSPVYGASRGAVLGPASGPGSRWWERAWSPVYGASRGSASAIRATAQAGTPRSPVNGARDKGNRPPDPA